MIHRKVMLIMGTRKGSFCLHVTDELAVRKMSGEMRKVYGRLDV